MANDAEAQKAIDELNGGTIEGRKIVVNKSEPKPEGERRSFDRNSGGSRGGYSNNRENSTRSRY
jgi:RNA recognition motif-containing protein